MKMQKHIQNFAEIFSNITYLRDQGQQIDKQKQ